MMEIEKSPPEMGKKLWNIVRIVFLMMRESIGKRKKMVDLHMLLKRGKIAGKAITNLLLHHHHSYPALTCRSNDANTWFVSPRDYEFSCSNTPIYPSYGSKRKNHHQHSRRHHQEVEELKVMHRVLDILNRLDIAEASAMTPLPGFGGSPSARVSPLPIKDNGEDHNHQVDKDAEEFIKKFYKDLKKQKRIAALESPSPYHECAK